MEAETRTALGRALRTTAMLAGLVVIWEVATRAELLNVFLFPAPTTIAGDTIEAFSDPPYISGAPLWYHIVKSVYRSLAGWVLGVFLGVAFGLVVEWRRQLGAVATALLEFTRPIPVILALPILVLIIGMGDTPRIIIIAWAVFVFQAINTIYGVRSARGALLPDVVRSFGGGEVDVLAKSVMGLARPQIVAGMRQGVGIALVLMVASELILSTDGLGWFIVYARRGLYPSLMYGGIFMVGLLGIMFGSLFRRLETHLLRAYIISN